MKKPIKIPRRQKRKLQVCQHCDQRFYYFQYAAEHAKKRNHYGTYRMAAIRAAGKVNP